MVALIAIALLAQALPPAPAAAIDPSVAASAQAIPAMPGDLSLAEFSSAERAVLDEKLRRYFDGEKREGFFWLGAGAAAAGFSTGAAVSSSDEAHGAIAPIAAIGLVQLGAAAVLFWRTDAQMARLSEMLVHRPCAFFAEEPARMQQVNRGFAIYPPIETVTLLGGAAMAGFGAAGKRGFLEGAGFGLVAQSVVMLVFDQFAAARAGTYERAIREAAMAHAGSCSAK